MVKDGYGIFYGIPNDRYVKKNILWIEYIL